DLKVVTLICVSFWSENSTETNAPIGLQVLDSDLIPSTHVEEDLKNHYVDLWDSCNCGSWIFLQSLGIPSQYLIYKKYNTLMIKNIHKFHTAMLIHCIRWILMGKKYDNLKENIPELKSKEIKMRSSPQLSNLLLKFSNFSTIFEGHLAMNNGDIGRLMTGAVISQGVKKLTQFSIQQPRMIILLNYFLLHGLSKLIENSLLITPTGGQRHFVPKYHYLNCKTTCSTAYALMHSDCSEFTVTVPKHRYMQTCGAWMAAWLEHAAFQLQEWLKYFFCGKNINCLKYTYSVNLTLIFSGSLHSFSNLSKRSQLMQEKRILQSHKNHLDLKSINNCLGMGHQNNLCTTKTYFGEYQPPEVKNFFSGGLLKKFGNLHLNFGQEIFKIFKQKKSKLVTVMIL
ncbi:hypothetical protein VP01_5869g1, partial [Puccinia sorghi]